jgi:hypothetical protein
MTLKIVEKTNHKLNFQKEIDFAHRNLSLFWCIDGQTRRTFNLNKDDLYHFPPQGSILTMFTYDLMCCNIFLKILGL